MKEQHTVLALSCAKRESTVIASGRAKTPSVITTAPIHSYKKGVTVFNNISLTSDLLSTNRISRLVKIC